MFWLIVLTGPKEVHLDLDLVQGLHWKEGGVGVEAVAIVLDAADTGEEFCVLWFHSISLIWGVCCSFGFSYLFSINGLKMWMFDITVSF